MDPFLKGTDKTGTGQVSFTRKNLSEPFHFLFEPFHFFRLCKRGLTFTNFHLHWRYDARRPREIPLNVSVFTKHGLVTSPVIFVQVRWFVNSGCPIYLS